MCNDTASKGGSAPIQFTLSDAALRDPSAGFGDWGDEMEAFSRTIHTCKASKRRRVDSGT
jgi:hypothetical protein